MFASLANWKLLTEFRRQMLGQLIKALQLLHLFCPVFLLVKEKTLTQCQSHSCNFFGEIMICYPNNFFNIYFLYSMFFDIVYATHVSSKFVMPLVSS